MHESDDQPYDNADHLKMTKIAYFDPRLNPQFLIPICIVRVLRKLSWLYSISIDRARLSHGDKSSRAMASSSEGGGTSSGGGGGGGASGTFRERRLSLAQQADPSAKGAARNRRLSIYDREEELQGGVNAFGAPVSTCGCKSVGGLEPVPGGSTAKINQDRALAVYPFMGEKVSSGPLHLPLVALGKRW